jgi:hypothetical protein
MSDADRLQITPLGASEPSIDLAACFHELGTDFALLATARERRLACAHGQRSGERVRWTIARFALEGDRVVRALDRTEPTPSASPRSRCTARAAARTCIIHRSCCRGGSRSAPPISRFRGSPHA